MERVRLTPPDGKRARGERARLYVRWMPHLGAEAVALYELLRVLPDIGRDEADAEELAELLSSTPERVEGAFETLVSHGFITEREGWLEVAEHPPVARSVSEESPERDIEVVRAEPEGVSADDYFRYMGSLPSPYILEFLNGYCGRDGLEADVVREALRIASERDARRVGYVRTILERWVERGVKSVEDVERFENERRLRLVGEGGAGYGTTSVGEGVSGGVDRRPVSEFKEGYEWFFGE